MDVIKKNIQYTESELIKIQFDLLKKLQKSVTDLTKESHNEHIKILENIKGRFYKNERN